MVQLYISDSVARIGYSQNRITVFTEATGEMSYPIETIDGVTIFGQPSMSTRFIAELLRREIELQMFSTDGRYFGRLAGPISGNAARQRAQVRLTADEVFSLAISKRIVDSKLRNQAALLRAYDREDVDLAPSFRTIQHSLTWIKRASSIPEVIGHEGNAAKLYFSALASLVPAPFAFSGRSTRPPRDPFNSMISLGYSILYKNVIGAVERHALNPCFGFLHRDGVGHATLASDLVETWRALIVDDTVLQLMINGQVSRDMFRTDHSTGGVHGLRETTRIMVSAFGAKVARAAPYLGQDRKRYTFQYALDLQVQGLVRAIEQDDPNQFSPLATMADVIDDVD